MLRGYGGRERGGGTGVENKHVPLTVFCCHPRLHPLIITCLHRQCWLEGDFPVKVIDTGSTSVSPCSIP